MIINTRGTHGSGKTTISKRLRDEHPHELVVEPVTLHGKNFKKANATVIAGGLIIVGRVQSGCDGIYPQEIVEDMLRYWAPRGHLVWENVLVSGNIGRWGALARELEPVNHSVWAVLDTPVELCIERVHARRAAAKACGYKHRGAGIKEDVLSSHWRRVRRTAARAALERIDVRWLPHQLAYELVHDTLVRAGWDCKMHGLLLPDVGLEQWCPTEDEAEQLIKTTRLPWETRWETSPVLDVPQQADAPCSRPIPDTIDSARDVLSDPLCDLGDLLGY